MWDSRRTHYETPALRSRLVAGLGYIGGVSLLLFLVLPRSPFVMRHVSIALYLHLLRFAWSVAFIAAYLISLGDQRPEWMTRFVLDASVLLLTGLPVIPGSDQTLLLVLSLPLGFTWLLSLAGLVIAVTGRTADFSAFLHANWPDRFQTPTVPEQARPDERLRAREVTERRLDRMKDAARVAVSERVRQEQMNSLEADIRTVLARLDHVDRMLSLGEISLGRFNRVNADLVNYHDRLRAALADLRGRRTAGSGLESRPMPPAELEVLEPIRVRTLAIIDLGGIPLRTYGHFPLDESIITGMVSAFETLSVEMFGSQVHTTQLSGGDVVHFSRGQMTVGFAIFEDEPAPNQIGQLGEFLHAFETANSEPLSRLPVDNTQLRDVDVPFEFAERTSDQEAGWETSQRSSPEAL